MSAWAWVKSKAGWIAAGVAVLLTALIFGSRGNAAAKAALALRRLEDATRSHDAAQAKADALKKKTDALAEALLAEELRLAAEKKDADAMDPDSVRADLKRRGLLK